MECPTMQWHCVWAQTSKCVQFCCSRSKCSSFGSYFWCTHKKMIPSGTKEDRHHETVQYTCCSIEPLSLWVIAQMSEFLSPIPEVKNNGKIIHSSSAYVCYTSWQNCQHFVRKDESGHEKQLTSSFKIWRHHGSRQAASCQKFPSPFSSVQTP